MGFTSFSGPTINYFFKTRIYNSIIVMKMYPLVLDDSLIMITLFDI